AYVEASEGYHSGCMTILSHDRNPVRRQFQIVSLPGAVPSQRVTEALKGSLTLVGTNSKRVKATESKTARLTRRSATKVGLSYQVVPHGRAIAQRIKATPGITGLSHPTVHIDGEVWYLDVGSSHPGAVVGPKGWAVRPLERYASWVQNVVRQ